MKETENRYFSFPSLKIPWMVFLEVTIISIDFKTLLFLFLAITGWHTSLAATGLPGPIKFVVDGHKIPSTAYGLYVREIGREDPALSINPEVPLNPASAIKIIPTLAALELLGPAFQWKTEVYALGNVNKGVLKGDILFKGYGDPHFVTEEFWKLLKELKRLGLSEIKGDFLIDHSYFKVPYEDPGAFDNEPHRAYNVTPNAFLVNYKAVDFHFIPDVNGRDVVVHSDPELANLKIDNRLRLRKRRCGGFQRGVSMTLPDSRVADHVIFEGKFPAGCKHYVMARTVLTHETFAFGTFKSLWKQSGGTISGQVRTASAPKLEAPFLVWDSKPLSDVIKLVNKFSNNVMTRQLLLTLGAELSEQPGTAEKGLDVIYEYLADLGLETKPLIIVNGAGLSRNTRISVKLLADILEYAWSIPYMPEFISSLSIIGMDGTAKNRLKSRKASGYAHVKTGTIDHVSAVTGYVNAKSGKKYIVSGILNHPDAHRGPGKELMNALINWAHDQ